MAPPRRGRGANPSRQGRGTPADPSRQGRGRPPSRQGRGRPPSRQGRGRPPSRQGRGRPNPTQFRAHKLPPPLRGEGRNLCDLSRIFASAKILVSDFCVRKNPSAYYAKASLTGKRPYYALVRRSHIPLKRTREGCARICPRTNPTSGRLLRSACALRSAQSEFAITIANS